MTEALLASAAPVFSIDGSVAGEVARDVLRLEVEEGTDGLKTMSLRLLAFGPRTGSSEEELLYLDGRKFGFGKRIEVSIGYADTDTTIFSGSISAIEACFSESREPEVLVLAEDRLMDLRMTRRMRTYENVSDADIARRIAGDHGIGANVNAPGPTYDVVQQWNVSDLAFLRERAARIQAEIWIQDNQLNFQARDQRNGAAVTLVQGNHLLTLHVRADLAHQRTKVKVSGYDAAGREAISEEAGADAIQSEASGGLSGVAALQQAFGERVSYRVQDMAIESGEARDWARAEMRRRGRMFVTAEGLTRGSPTMVVGSPLTLERIGAPFEGDGYRVTQVCHSYDLQSGYRTRFQAERAKLNRPGLV